MKQTPYIFNQLINYLPKDVFDRLVKKYNGNAHAKNYTCWNHLLVMIWAQFTSRRSLRDIEISLRAHSDKIYRMGIGKNISRNNIGSSEKWSDIISINKKKTAEKFVFLNNHKQIYKYEQQFSILCVGSLQPPMYQRGIQR